MRKSGLAFVLLVYSLRAIGQCPTVSFNIPSDICQDQSIDIQDVIFDGQIESWDFCDGDLNNAVIGQDLLELSSFEKPVAFELQKDGDNWIGFLPGNTASVITRLEFGSDLSNNSPGITILSDFQTESGTDITITSGRTMKLFKENDMWYGLIIGFANSDLWRLNFGNSLLNKPTITSLISSGLDRPYDMTLENDNGNIVALVSNFNGNSITQINFGSSILNDPSFNNVTISGASRLTGLAVKKICDKWYGLVGQNKSPNASIWKLEFQSGLGQPPAVSTIDLLGNDLRELRGLSIQRNDQELICFIQSAKSKMYKIKFNFDLSATTEVTDLGALNILNAPIGLTLQKSGTTWFGFSVESGLNRLNRINFQDNCNATNPFSDVLVPKNISYTQNGTYQISLTVIDANGSSNVLTKTINVNSVPAPNTDFILDQYNCISNVVSLNGVNGSSGQTINSWSWDFGDGSPAGTSQNVTHSFTNPGIYEIGLTVASDNGCGQTRYKTTTILEEPVPNFIVSESVPCTNSFVSFENSTPGDFGDVISWTWDFGDGESSNLKNPIHAFAASGTYNVKLIASIPGCITEKTISIDVLEGPIVAYNFTNDCQNNNFSFVNNTTGINITGYTWDFGDGATSNLVSPTHTYTDPGDYTVILTADNADGCSVTNTQTVTVHALPEVAFINELACSSGITQFFDQSTALAANITGWLWDFGDGNTSTDKDPTHVYQNSGTFPVTLTATTNFGCTATLEKMVDVIVGPTVDFAINQVCLGEEAQFEDLSTASDGSAINSWFWEIDGQVFTEQNPTMTFTQPGSYPVTLTVTSSTFCTATTTKEVTINPLPAAEFGVENACVNDIVRFTDESTVTGDDIDTYDWNFGDLGSSSETNPVFSFEETGNFEVTLTITTVTGCISTTSKNISILDRPEGTFTTDVSQGAPPLVVNFFNSSSGADNFDWDFGNGDKSTVTNPIITFSDLGVFEVTMVALTAAGCTDTVKRTINVVEPVMDLAIEGATILSQDGRTRISLDIKNNGTLFVKEVEITLEIGSEASVTETLEQTIAPGELVVYPLNVSINNRITTPYLCATILPIASEFVEANHTNNTYCINLNETSNVIDPFPNPADRHVTIGVVLEESEKILLSMHNALGQPVLKKEILDASVGLNEFKVDLSGIGDGIYWLRLRHGFVEEIYRIMVDK